MKKGILITLFMALMAAGVQAQQKIAFADADSILVSLPEFKTQQKTLETYGKQLNSTLESKQKELQNKFEDYQKNAGDWLPEIVKEKEKEINQLDKSLREFQQEAQQNLARREQELLNPLYEKIQKGIEAVAKEEAYTFIMPKNVFLYAADSDDITVKVIKKLGGVVAPK